MYNNLPNSIVLTQVERLRAQHACHLEELRARLAGERASSRREDRVVLDKYKCLKEKYARLKHDVKVSLMLRQLEFGEGGGRGRSYFI